MATLLNGLQLDSEKAIMTNATPPRSTLDRALAGDRNALEELLLLRYDWLRDLANRAIPIALRERISAEEVLQEAFVNALRSFASFESRSGEAGLFAWMKTIVQNASRDALRQQTRSREAAMTDHAQGNNKLHSDSVSDFIGSLAVARDPRASVVACGQEMTNAFYLALANLEPEYKEVIELLYFQQLTVEEVAAKLETTAGAVRGRRQRAREAIREAMVRLSHYV